MERARFLGALSWTAKLKSSRRPESLASV